MPNQQRLTGIFWYGKWLSLITLLVLMVDLFCVFILWAPNGVWQLQNVLNQEIALLALSQSDINFLAGMIQSFYDTIFVSSGIDGMMRHTASLSPSDERQQSATDFTETLRPAIETCMIGLQMFALRIGVLILALPFLLIITLAATTDGYLAWFLRRTSGGRESGFIYHRAKRSLAASFLLLWAAYLMPPIPMNPVYIIPPFLLAAGITTYLQVAFFKKFL